MKPWKLFVPITKVDATKRLVYGTIAVEQKDKMGETFDYESSKPLFEAWSADTLDRSNGKSYGNVRAMHGKVAAGLLPEPISFDDENKRVDAVAKIVDDAEWEKVTEGVYTGFSIGGEYVKQWADGEGGVRYTAAPFEVSIVDNPAMPGARFAMIKADGIEQRAFASTQHEGDPALRITNEMVLERANQLAKAAGSEKPMDFIAPARAELEAEIAKAAPGAADPTAGEGGSAAAAKPETEPAQPVEKTAPTPPPGAADLVQVWQARDGRAFAKKADAIAHNLTLDDPDSAEALAARARAAMEKAEGKKKADEAEAPGEDAAKAKKADDGKGDAKKPYGDVDYADPGYQNDKKKRYPIDTAKRVRAAWSYINKPKNPKPYSADEIDKIKAKIVSAWKKLIDDKGPPEAAEKLSVGSLQKGMHDIARLAHLIGELDWLQDALEMEAGWENDQSDVPAALKENIAGLVGTLKALVDEETSELFDDDESEAFSDLMELAAGTLAREDFALVEKVATGKLGVAMAKAKLTMGQMDKVQAMHDHACAMGAACNTDASKEAAKALGLEKKLSKDEMERAQAIHDHCCSMGAKCMGADGGAGMGKAAGGDAAQLSKLTADNAVLKTALKDLTERLDALEKAPIPQPPVRLHVVGKGDDDTTTNEANARAANEFIKGMSPDMLAVAALKLTHAQGGQPYRGIPRSGT